MKYCQVLKKALPLVKTLSEEQNRIFFKDEQIQQRYFYMDSCQKLQ